MQKEEKQLRFFGDWTKREDVFQEFKVDDHGENILFGWYSYEDYSGSAFVLFRADNNLWEVNGSHCSCYGCEEQWKPEIVIIDELKQREFYYMPKEIHATLLKIIEKEERKRKTLK